ncbi:hypothetical protein LUZ60_013512 [Juncus effusus]|nr:hypothetical protein LUZ60_013512 [Juncus effusus]
MPESVENLGGCVITTSPKSPNCSVIFALKDQNYLLHSKPKDENWTKELCSFAEENFRNGEVVVCNGMLCALFSFFSRHYAVFNYVNSLVSGTASWSTMSIIPSLCVFHNMPDDYNNDRTEKVAHVAVFGEDVVLLFVVLFYGRVVMEVCIFSLRIGADGKPCWRRETGVKGYTFFLGGRNNVAFTTNHEKLQHDCIYLLRSYHEEVLLYTIDMDNQTFSFELIPDEAFMDSNNLCWVVPSRTRKTKKKIGRLSLTIRSIEDDSTTIRMEEENSSDISSQWADLPTELLESLISNLSLVERIYIRAVCKAWSSIPNHLHEAKVWPWLMYCPKKSNQCRFIDPLHGKEYSMDLKFLGSKKITLHFSKDGWVLASSGKNLFVINPFTRKTVKLPCYRLDEETHGLSFSSVPTSPDFVVFGIKGFELVTWSRGKSKWNRKSVSNEVEFDFSFNNPVFFREEVYFLGRIGNLGVFNPKTKKCRILDRPTPILDLLDVLDEYVEDCYLMEIEGELISVFPGNEDIEDSYRVFKLDETEMDWIELHDLGDLTLFIDRRNSIAKRVPFRDCANRIYFPRFDDGDKRGAFYSIETCKYCPRVYGLTEPINCVWIEPNLNP